MTYKVAGSIRFNTDSSKLELYRGNEWVEIDSTSPDEQTGGTRGLIFGGEGSNLEIQFNFLIQTPQETQQILVI